MAKYILVTNGCVIYDFEEDGAKEAKQVLDIYRLEEPDIELFVRVKENVVVDKAD